MIEVLFGESEAASMKAAKSTVVLSKTDGPTAIWTAGKKTADKNILTGSQGRPHSRNSAALRWPDCAPAEKGNTAARLPPVSAEPWPEALSYAPPVHFPPAPVLLSRPQRTLTAELLTGPDNSDLSVHNTLRTQQETGRGLPVPVRQASVPESPPAG